MISFRIGSCGFHDLLKVLTFGLRLFEMTGSRSMDEKIQCFYWAYLFYFSFHGLFDGLSSVIRKL